MRTVRMMICYVQKDKAVAEAIARLTDGMVFDDLDAKVEVVYMDKPLVGCANDWVEWSTVNVKRADIVMQLWTMHTMTSAGKYIADELALAKVEGKQLIILDEAGYYMYTTKLQGLSQTVSVTYLPTLEMNEHVEGVVLSVLRDRVYKCLNGIQPEYRAPVVCIRQKESVGEPDANFVGREAELAQIEQYYREGKKVVIVHGEGGIGKTEIVRRYVQEKGLRDLYAYKLCSDDHDLSLATEIVSLGYNRDLTEEERRLSTFEQAKIRIDSMRNMDKRFILVLDNYNADFDHGENRRILDYLAEAVPFLVMFSSRTESRNQSIGLVEVESLPMERQKELFYRESGLAPSPDNDRKIEALSHSIAGHTMTLDLCARLVEKGRATVETLTEDLLAVARKIDTAKLQNEDVGRATVNEHLLHLFELADMSEGQRDLLYALCYFCQLGATLEELEKILERDAEDDLDYLEAIGLAKRDARRYHLHPLVAGLVNRNYHEGRAELGNAAYSLICDDYKPLQYDDSVTESARKRAYWAHLVGVLSYRQTDRWPLAVSYLYLGKIAETTGDFKEAKSYYERSIEIRERLDEEKGSPDNLQNLSYTCRCLGTVLSALGDLQAAKTSHRRALEMRERLVEELREYGFSRRSLTESSIAESYCDLGYIALNEGDLKQAKLYYERAMEIDERLAVKLLKAPNVMKVLSASCVGLGDIAEAEGDLNQARSYYERAMEIAERLAAQLGTPDSLRNLSVSCDKLGDIAQAEGELQEAKSYYERGMEIDERLAEQLGTPDSLRNLSVSCDKLGDVAVAEGNLQEAKAYYKRSMERFERLAAQLGTPDSLRDLSVSCDKLGDIAKAEGEPQEAKAYSKRSMEIREGLAEQLGTPDSLRDLSVSCDKLGDVAVAEGNLQEAKAYYKRSMEIRERLSETLGTPQSLDDLLVSHAKLFALSFDTDELAWTLGIACELHAAGKDFGGRLKTTMGIIIKHYHIETQEVFDAKVAELLARYAELKDKKE